MKYLIFNRDKFSEGAYSKIIQDIYKILTERGVIMSEEASTEVFKNIFAKGAITTAESVDIIDGQITVDDEVYAKGWEQLKKEL